MSADPEPDRTPPAADAGEDAPLVRRLLAGDASAFDAVVERYQGRLLRIARRILRNAADAGDATQATFVKVFARISTYDPQRPFSHWVHRILRNECLNLIRARRPQEPLARDLPVTSDPLAAIEAAERRRRVQAALRELPRDHLQAIVLRHYGERSYREIGAALGVTEDVVRRRLFSARKCLARLLATA